MSLLLVLLYAQARGEDNLVQLRTAIHVTSSVSEGRHSLREIAEAAQDNDIDVVVFTDRDLMRWEYGAWPLRNLIKKRVENNSVLRYGTARYLREIEQLKTDFPDMVFVPGVESAPFYYWEGSPLKRNLTMHNWHKHILAVGMAMPGDYNRLPVIGSPRGLRKGFDALSLWPALLIVAGILCLRKREYGYRDHAGRSLGPRSRRWQICGALLALVGVLFLCNNWPFCSYAFDQYHGDLHSKPYQDFIGYVDKKGGLTFWAHPEAQNISEMGNIAWETTEHSRELLLTRGYTGFSVFPEGYRKIGVPGGLWDKILGEYCAGSRRAPVWAIAGLAHEGSLDLAGRMAKIHTVVLVPEKSGRAVLDALRNGKAYAVCGSRAADFSLDTFHISDTDGGHTLHITCRFEGKQDKVTVKIIKNGEIVDARAHGTPLHLTYPDDNIAPGKSYYRLEIRGKGLHLVTNPIFVTRSKAAARP